MNHVDTLLFDYLHSQNNVCMSHSWPLLGFRRVLPDDRLAWRRHRRRQLVRQRQEGSDLWCVELPHLHWEHPWLHPGRVLRGRRVGDVIHSPGDRHCVSGDNGTQDIRTIWQNATNLTGVKIPTPQFFFILVPRPEDVGMELCEEVSAEVK